MMTAAVVSRILMHSDPRSTPPKGEFLHQQNRYFIWTDVSVFFTCLYFVLFSSPNLQFSAGFQKLSNALIDAKAYLLHLPLSCSHSDHTPREAHNLLLYNDIYVLHVFHEEPKANKWATILPSTPTGNIFFLIKGLYDHNL